MRESAHTPGGGVTVYVMMVARECAPVAQAGGLGDVVCGLSRELELRGNSVEIVLPKHDCMRYDGIYGLTLAYEDLWVPWEMTSQKHGVSALGIQRSLGLGSCQTAWAMPHRYRAAMVRPGRERLAGCVEVDEAYLGGVEGGVLGRQTRHQGDRRDRGRGQATPRVSGGFDCTPIGQLQSRARRPAGSTRAPVRPPPVDA